jgi:hypothetical protein
VLSSRYKKLFFFRKCKRTLFFVAGGSIYSVIALLGCPKKSPKKIALLGSLVHWSVCRSNGLIAGLVKKLKKLILLQLRITEKYTLSD